MTTKRNIAVVLAGGVGKRLGISTPKQFYKVAGKMVIEHTIDVFERNHHIDEIAIVSNAMLIPEMENMVLKNGWKKVKRILKGGNERYDSSLSAIHAYEKEKVNLIFHDAVRPLLSQRTLNDVISALQQYKAIDVAVPSADTIIEVEGDFIHAIPDRSRLRRGQTPQAFDIDVIAKAYQVALKDPDFRTTDDCGVVCKYLPDVPVYVVMGEESNMKLTYKEDTYMMDKLFQLKNSAVGNISIENQNLTGKVAVVFGASYGIGAYLVNLLVDRGAVVHAFSRSQTHTDVGNRAEVAAALQQVYQANGHIDYIVNTAGLLNKEPLTAMNYDTLCYAVQTNYMGTVHVALESYPYLKESKGQLLFFTSSSYTRGRAFYSIYSSTKAAIVNFVQAIAQEWEVDGIRVNCINPERTKTPMRVKNFGTEPENSLLTPEVVAQTTLNALLSNYTGQVIDVKLDKDDKE